MLNGTNMLGKDKPCWIISNALETIKAPVSHHRPPFGALATVGGWVASGSAITIGTGYGRMIAWLAGLPRRAGRRLFAMNDTEAGWRGWRVTELRGGLARSYRDSRFDLLNAVRAPATAKPDTPERNPHEQDRQDVAEATDRPATVHRCPGDWDDVHGWPWGGER